MKVLCYRPRESHLLVLAGIGWKEGVIGTATLSADLSSPPGRAFQTAEPVNIKNFAEQEEYVYSDFLKEHGIVALTNVPVLIDGAAWGVLEVDSTVPRDFSEDTTDFLTAAAAMIGTFVQRHNARPDEEARLMAVAAEAQKREVLLRDMQHRVKNNFQLVLASISTQKRRSSAEEVHRALDYIAKPRSMRSRLRMISSHPDKMVELSNFPIISALCAARSVNKLRVVEVDVETDELELSIDRAGPIGLILNETAINSIKHAFGPQGGRISVSLEGGIGYGEARLIVTDNGRGIGNRSEHGSGLKLITSLAKQIGGTIEQKSSDSGTTTSLRFPLIT